MKRSLRIICLALACLVAWPHVGGASSTICSGASGVMAGRKYSGGSQQIPNACANVDLKQIFGAALVLWLRSDLGVTTVVGPVVATGTTPPTVTLSGTPSTTQTSAAPYVELDCTTLGVLGVSQFTVKVNGTVTATNVFSASSGVVLPGSGLTAGWAAGASATNDVYTSNIVTSAWADQSGQANNATQAFSVNQLTYVTGGGANGHPYLQSTFNGSNGTSLKGASPLVTAQPVEYFVVARTNVASPPGAFPYLFNVAGTLNDCATLQVTNTHNIEQDNGAQANAITMTVNADFVVDSYFNGASSTLALNGGAPVGPASAGANGSFSGGYLISSTTAGNSWGGLFYEIVVVNRQIAVGELTRMLSYFNARYDL